MTVNFQIPTTLFEAKRYFQHHPDLMAVKSCAHEEPMLSRLNHRCFYIQANCQLLMSYVTQAIGALAELVGASDLSKRCHVLSYHLRADSQILKGVRFYGSDLKMGIRNIHHLDTANVYLQATPSPLYEAASFYHPQGICRGISDWFLFLYLKTRNHFTSSEKQILAVGKLFEQGAPRAAALIQSMQAEDVSWKALKLKVTTDVLTFNTQRTSIQKIAQKIYRLPKGAYGVYFFSNTAHRINYIRTSSHQRYLINPQARAGIMSISSSAQLGQILDHSLSKKTILSIDRVSLS